MTHSRVMNKRMAMPVVNVPGRGVSKGYATWAMAYPRSDIILSAPVLQVKFPSAHYVETIHICTFLQSFYILSHIHRKVDLDN